MTDPIESSQPEIIARILGAVTLVLGAIAALWRTIFGSKAERADASERAAEIALRAAEHAEIALRAAEHAGERAEREAARAEADTKSVRVERDDCTARLAAHEERSARERAEDRARIAALEAGLAEHATCGPRIARLEEEQRLSRQMLDDYMRTGSTPPPARMPRPDEVRRAAAEETGP